MGPPLEPPTWPAVAGLLTAGALVYALLFAVAVSASFSRRWSSLRSPHAPLFRPVRTLHVFMDSLLRYVFPLALLRMLISTSICVAYVYITYLGYIPIVCRICNAVLGTFLLLHLLVLVVRAVNPVPFVLCGEAVMEALSLASLIFARDRAWLNFSFLQAYTVLRRYFKVEPYLENMFLQKISPFRRQLARLTLQFTVFIYIFACGLQLFEVLGDPTESLTATTFELTLANSLYFTVVTIFTVGYGDFVPYTLFGRLWIIFIIVFGAYLVSRKIGQVIDVVSGLRRGMGSFVKDEHVEHCVVCGNVKWEYLKTFLQEFYADSKHAQIKIVVMCDKPNWTETVWNNFFDSVNPYRYHVVYLEGSCLTRDDLERAQAEYALAVFVLNNQHDPEPYLEDSETLKRILTVRSFAPKLPVYSMCALRDSMLQITVALEHREILSNFPSLTGNTTRAGFYGSRGFDSVPGRTSISSLLGEEFYSAGGEALSIGGASLAVDSSGTLDQTGIRAAFTGDFTEDDDDDDDDYMLVNDGTDLKSEAICMQEVEMSLLAENVFCNGLSTLLSNLVLNVAPVTKLSDHPWMAEYKIGAECRFAHVKLPLSLLNMRFSDMALVLYDYGILLVATKRFSEAKWRAITPDTVMNLNSIGLVITFHSAHLVEKVITHAAERLLRIREDMTFAEDSSHGAPSAIGDDVPQVDAVPLPVDPSQGGVRLARHASEPVSKPSQASIFHDDRTIPAGSSVPIPDSAHLRYPRGAIDTADRSPTHPKLVLAGTSDVGRAASSNSPDHTGGNHPPTSASSAVPFSASRSSFEDNLDLLSSRRIPETRRAADDLDFVADVVLERGQEIVLSSSPSAEDLRSRSMPITHSRGTVESTVQALPVRRDTMSSADASAVHGAGHDRQPSNIGGSLLEIRLSRTEPASTSPGLGARRPRGRDGSKVSFPKHLEFGTRRPAGNVAETLPTRKHSVPHRRQAESGSFQGASKVFYGDALLPVRLKGHIVVCVIGPMGLVNLKHFLRRVWIKRRGFKRETPVVAICPKITESVEDDIAMFPANALYVIQGNSLSISTLKRAQYERARAIVVLACEDKNDIDRMDAKAIFTIMTLDYVLGESSNTFVCTMLDAEESMKLLRAPAHPRRRGADLGRVGDEYARSLSFYLSNDPRHASVPASPFAPRRSSRPPHGFVPQSPLNIARNYGDRGRQPGKSPQGLGETFLGGIIDRLLRRRPEDQPDVPSSRTNLWSTRSDSIRQLVSDDVREQQPEYGTFGRALAGSASYSLLGASRDSKLGAFVSGGATSAMNMLFNSSSFGPTPQTSSVVLGFGEDDGGVGFGRSASVGNNLAEVGIPRDRGMESSRSELFEKQRYASGEMMISSVLVALLIREFAMPGIMSVVRKLFGVGVGKDTRSMKKSWIRTHRIPRLWIESGTNGQRTYRELFEVLLTFKCFPLGLYRSGDVMVRVQVGDDQFSDVLSSQTSPDAVDDFDQRSLGHPPELGAGGQILFCSATPSPVGTRGGPATGGVGGGGGGGGGSSALPAHVDRLPGVGGVAYLDSGPGAEDVPPLMTSSFNSDSGSPTWQTYRCSTTGHVATFEEIAGGENVLPYVYTNPEPYTLVSEHDAVYILAHPQLRLPEEWKV